ncbi:Glutathione synthetase [Ceratocystis lukuohia]|uniref:Glutathione synthetase n=1 Tax=Ceratocystis lukuohia TaxID=2019550 RepID=A0ABR4MG28_9PEZI
MSLPKSYPPALTAAEEDHIVSVIKDWTIANGLCIRPPPAVFPLANDPHAILGCHVPVTLFPSRFPRECFDQAHAVQKAYGELYIKIGRDEKFLADIVRQVEGDDFTVNLWKVHERVKAEGYVQPLSLGLFRSDYMVHENVVDGKTTLQAKQVEFNTISVSFGGLSSKTSQLHRYLASAEFPLLSNPLPLGTVETPLSDSAQELAAGLRAAYDAYNNTEGAGALPRCVLFIVQDGERNVFDQRQLEYYLTQPAAATQQAVSVFRLPISQIRTHTTVEDSAKRRLIYTVPQNPAVHYEVAVVYFRSAYDPSDYPVPEVWEGRYHLERSNAIKCPSVLTQLAGCKKVQQVLATPRANSTSEPPAFLGQFVDEDAVETALLRETFTNIYPMDTSAAGLAARKMALDPELCQAFVLKPQREGGGNNIYRSAIPAYLQSIPEETWGSYILMKLITPPPVTNVILRNGVVEKGGVICELGVYSTAVWNQESGEVLRNQHAGYLLRTKGDKSEEGGVAAGYGCMDSVALV